MSPVIIENKTGTLRAAWSRVTRDPNAIWMREMRQAARVTRTRWILFVGVLTPSFLLLAIGAIAAGSHTSPAELGSVLFQTFFSLAYFVVMLGGPTVAANGIAAEREGRTWEAILLTGMRPKEIARGKFLAAYTSMSLYLVALAPVGALSLLFGGVTALEVILAFALLFVLAALSVAFGLAVSSLMSNLRGALVITLMLAACIAPSILSIGGFGASFGAHKLWPEVPEAMPIWLPLAWEHAPFGWRYALLLIALPLLLAGVPAWFFYESTVANLAGAADDRSSALKRWYVCTGPLIALGAGATSHLVPDDDAKTGLAIGGMILFAVYVLLCAMLFASEPPGPSRRVEIHWRRKGAGPVARFLGPGLFRTMLLVDLVGVAGLAVIALLGVTAIGLHPASGSARHLREIGLAAADLAPHLVFAVGLVALLRTRTTSAGVARILALGILVAIALAPWMAAALAGALTDAGASTWIVLAAPSPFFLAPMLDEIGSYAHGAPMVLVLGGTFAIAWGIVGVALLAIAHRRGSAILSERDAIFQRASASYDAEDRAIAPPPTVDAATGG